MPEAAPPKRKRLALIVGGAILLVGMATGGYFLLRGSWTEGGSAPASEISPTAYVEVPAITVNLRSGDGQARFLKLRFILVAADAGRSARIREKLPVVIDALQSFLRELRPEDMSGSAAVFRVKEEMMARTQSALGPDMVRDVLIQDLIEQ